MHGERSNTIIRITPSKRDAAALELLFKHNTRRMTVNTSFAKKIGIPNDFGAIFLAMPSKITKRIKRHKSR
jgi:hypothetical protein